MAIGLGKRVIVYVCRCWLRHARWRKSHLKNTEHNKTLLNTLADSKAEHNHGKWGLA